MIARQSTVHACIPCAFGVSVHVEKDVNAILVDLGGGFDVARNLGQVDEMLRLTLDLRTETRAVICGRDE